MSNISKLRFHITLVLKYFKVLLKKEEEEEEKEEKKECVNSL